MEHDSELIEDILNALIFNSQNSSSESFEKSQEVKKAENETTNIADFIDSVEWINTITSLSRFDFVVKFLSPELRSRVFDFAKLNADIDTLNEITLKFSI